MRFIAGLVVGAAAAVLVIALPAGSSTSRPPRTVIARGQVLGTIGFTAQLPLDSACRFTWAAHQYPQPGTSPPPPPLHAPRQRVVLRFAPSARNCFVQWRVWRPAR